MYVCDSTVNYNGKMMLYLSLGVCERDAEIWHRPEDGDKRLDGVAVDDGTVLLEVLGSEAALVDDPGRVVQMF